MKIVVNATCKVCGASFQKSNNNHKYCSASCSYKSRKEYTKNWIKENPAYMLLHGAKWRAKKKGIDFDLNLEDLKVPSVCPVLGITLVTNQTGKPGFYNNSYSLDRVNPSKGYTKDNIRIISNRANLLKSNATVEELEKILADAKLCALC